jgi:hypothetical protein
MSRSSPKVPDYTYGGGERLIQLRHLADTVMQLQQKIVRRHDQLSPYIENT